jgi:anthranilate synthase component 1
VYGRNAHDSLRRVVEITEPVDLLQLHGRDPARYPFLLQSTARDARHGRYDILFAHPQSALELDAQQRLTRPAEISGGGFLETLDNWWQRERCDVADRDLPFIGGWFLYLGYEFAAEIEPVLELHADDLLPRAFAVRCTGALVHDRVEGRYWAVSETEAVDEIVADSLRGPSAKPSRVLSGNGNSVVEDAPQVFLDAVERAKRYIAAGDIYQANLSRGWTRSAVEADATAIYAALCESNPAPFAGLVRWKDTAIISSSPERLLKLRDGVASTRPIAGTRPRSENSDLDGQLSTELFTHPKERAEHVMLIDLERNDLGRICDPGSVEVDEMMVLESYAHVHHIVSNVRGRLRKDVTPGDAIRAVFPGGTITGCPKVRCMQIIAELEGAARGAYTGSFGYLNRDGSMDLNILIRTMVLRAETLRLRAGSGIVADSVPEAELAETRAKAEGMLRSLRQ